jgi:peptidoglycan/xylan/chitin deacetylase (PgdA/CDA1 family)
MLLELGLRPPGMERIELVAGTPHAALVLLLRSLSRADIERVLDTLDDRVGVEAQPAGMLPLTWDMLARMQRAGMVIGSHTKTHAWLTRERPADAFDELRGSREVIERRLGTRVEHFAYPDGRFDRALPHAVAAAGYRFAYTTCTHRHPAHRLLTLPRRMLWENSCLDSRGRFSPAIMSCQMHGIFDLVNGCDQDHAA